ncbi:adenylyltransferase/cytidyltransferase family protein [Mycoplasma sp. ATU-Cv-508]|uniref:adenylyltransferase/cytidyltransferase family protein n=1 Tax=Mycoplasma sp. ATU-Cv-508 TaxID=2048001 RepID=UPI001374C115
MKIAIFGGSFDPVHAAHIELARFALQSGVCDQLIFVPTYQNPHKKNSSHRFWPRPPSDD